MKFLSRRMRQILGEMTPKNKEGEEKKWRDSNINTKQPDEQLSAQLRLSPSKTLPCSVKSELPNDLDRSNNEALDSVLNKPFSRLNIKLEESVEKNECEEPLKIAENCKSDAVNTTVHLKPSGKCSEPESKIGISGGKHISQERAESKLDVLRNSNTLGNVNSKPKGGKFLSEGDLETTKAAKKEFKEEKPAAASETLPGSESASSEKMGSKTSRPCRTKSAEPVSEHNEPQARTEADNNNNSDRKEFVKNTQPPTQLKIHRSGKAEITADRDSTRGNEIESKYDKPITLERMYHVGETKRRSTAFAEVVSKDRKVEEIVLKFQMFILKEDDSWKYKARNPHTVPSIPCTVGDACDNLLLTESSARDNLQVLTGPEVEHFFASFPPQEVSAPAPVLCDEGMVMSDVTDSDRDDSSSAPDSGLDSPRPGECDTPPAQYSCVNKILKDRFKANAFRQSAATPISSPSGSLGSSISSPMSLRDSPQPQYAATLSPEGTPSSDHADPDAQLHAIRCTRTYEEWPNHKFMRAMCDRPPTCRGYSTTGPDREPQLIGFLKEATKKRPDFQRIYESARCYLTYHLGLLYDEDNAGYTALYYAAKINEFDQIAGFIVECLLEAQEKCSLINDSAKTHYRIEEERYGEVEDNILHCLARWHSSSNSYIPVAHTLFKTCNMLQKLKFVQNKEGKYPCQLCIASDMWEFLGGNLITQ
ncbi:Cell division cycle protein 20-like protein B [Frankliniella fusca]|uniref:Cell division cycle protein 20-like protein B n=1 Tax=Frankliniella fusca TaxID=407009 RepID=A0AAE1L5Q6_9NEOP|nr:Cell division cycle protein 20-like protein B [Frankliniella fusca]